MTAFEVEQPILNSPVRGAGRALADPGRRGAQAHPEHGAGPATSTAIPKAAPPEADQPVRGHWQELDLVNLIRERLSKWREDGYPGQRARPST